MAPGTSSSMQHGVHSTMHWKEIIESEHCMVFVPNTNTALLGEVLAARLATSYLCQFFISLVDEVQLHVGLVPEDHSNIKENSVTN
eukprot:s3953_g4.t1